MNYPITINFGGFYDSIHDDILDRGVANFFGFVDESGEPDHDRLRDIDRLTWKDARDQYCEEYLNTLNSVLDTNIKFQRLEYPQYYNYSTDTIEALIDRKDALRLFEYLRGNDLKKEALQRVHEVTTSRDGYIAHYQYCEAFESGHEWLLLTCLMDTILQDLEYDYPVIAESFYPQSLFVEGGTV